MQRTAGRLLPDACRSSLLLTSRRVITRTGSCESDSRARLAFALLRLPWNICNFESQECDPFLAAALALLPLALALAQANSCFPLSLSLSPFRREQERRTPLLDAGTGAQVSSRPATSTATPSATAERPEHDALRPEPYILLLLPCSPTFILISTLSLSLSLPFSLSFKVMRDLLISVWTLFFVCHSSEQLSLTSSSSPVRRSTRPGQSVRSSVYVPCSCASPACPACHSTWPASDAWAMYVTGLSDASSRDELEMRWTGVLPLTSHGVAVFCLRAARESFDSMCVCAWRCN